MIVKVHTAMDSPRSYKDAYYSILSDRSLSIRIHSGSTHREIAYYPSGNYEFAEMLPDEPEPTTTA